MNMEFKRKLPIPKEIKEQYPITPELETIKAKRDAEIKDIFEGKDDRLVLIIGPCSADTPDSVMEYMYRLAKVQEQVKDKISKMVKIIDETYFTVINIDRLYIN